VIVSEIFGPTWQGEGPSLGRRCGFVRLGRCNLACTWCDTPYTWDWTRYDPAKELSRLTVTEIVDQLDAMDVDMVVITGGEPLLQQRELGELVAAIAGRAWRIEVETAGTLAPDEALAPVDRFNVSPKLAGSGNPLDRRYKPDVLRALQSTGRAAFKFVVTDEAELDEVGAIVDECRLTDVWIMPEGTDPAALVDRARSLADPVLARGWNLTTRLHVLLWGDRRGV
jgi:7-cyano-7-deazaguanosine (preQ0) biosynthesis protein QueE